MSTTVFGSSPGAQRVASLTWDEVMVAMGRLTERLTAVEREQVALRETLDGLLGAQPSTLPATPHWPGTGPQRNLPDDEMQQEARRMEDLLKPRIVLGPADAVPEPQPSAPPLEMLCMGGVPHRWMPTGAGHFLWAGDYAGLPRPPDSPFEREEMCSVCGEIRYVPAPAPPKPARKEPWSFSDLWDTT